MEEHEQQRRAHGIFAGRVKQLAEGSLRRGVMPEKAGEVGIDTRL